MNDEYLLKINAKLVKTGTLIVIIVSLLVVSSQAIASPNATDGIIVLARSGTALVQVETFACVQH